MATAAALAFVQKLYVAYYQRPADYAGQQFWAEKFDKEGGASAIATAFATSAESVTLYGSQALAAQINAVYLASFGRAAETVGLQFYINEINAGRLTTGTMAVAVLNGAVGTDLSTLNSKLAVAAAYTTAVSDNVGILKYVGDASAAAARTFLDTVTAANQAASTTAVITQARALVVPTVTTGSTFTLTTATDSITGTAGNDTFLATAATTNPTFNAADTINGGAGTDTLNLTIDVLALNSVSGASTSAVEVINFRNVSGNEQTIVGGNFAGATSFVSDRSTSKMILTGLAAGQAVGIAGNGVVTNGAVDFTYGASVAAGVINISGGTTDGALTEAGAAITSNTINSTGAANTVGAIILSGTANTALTVNATTALTTGNITGFTGTASTITVAGAAVNNAGTATALASAAVTLGTIENATVATINASGLTAGGVGAVLSTNVAIVVTGGAGDDFITTGAVLTTGSVAAGAGTGDRLTLADDTHIATVGLGAKYTGFEVVSIGTGGSTLDLDNLAAANTLTGLRLTGSSTVTNINAATAGNVSVLASGTDTLTVKNALTPGQIDTLKLTVSDELAAVNTITLTAPTIAGVEVLNLVATDHTTITTLANALALTNLNISGAGNVVVTTLGAVALQTNYNINASTATGNLTLDATGATTNGFSLTGGSGINTITGGSQVFSVNLAASTAKADIIAIGGAAGSTGGTLALPNLSITGFTNSATVLVGDKVDVIDTAVIGAAVAAAASAADATVTAALSATGIFTFTGTGAAAATLATKIAIATEAAYGGATQYRTTAFEHGGNTYLVENGDAVAGYTAGTDIVVNLVGVTGVTALSTTASAASTVWVI